jgi:hypothetical protein
MDLMVEDPQIERPDETQVYEAPCFEVISLSCEISAYAPDDEPLF